MTLMRGGWCLCWLVFLDLEAGARLLVMPAADCALSPAQLAEELQAFVVGGTEGEMKAQILEIDASTGGSLIILGMPVSNLPKFASKVYYDYICVGGEAAAAIEAVKSKAETVPATDADLPKLSPEERGGFYRLLDKAAAALKKCKVTFWAISGTLLGACRHAGMIPWDDDVDLIVHVRDKDKLELMGRLLSAQGLCLYAYGDYFYKLYPTNGRPVCGKDGTVYPWLYPFVDIFLVNEVDGEVRIVSPTYPWIDLYPPTNEGGRGWWLNPAELELPAPFMPFGPLQVPVPHDAEAILSREYGADWRISAYMWHNHANESPWQRIKVQVTDYSPPAYILPKE